MQQHSQYGGYCVQGSLASIGSNLDLNMQGLRYTTDHQALWYFLKIIWRIWLSGCVNVCMGYNGALRKTPDTSALPRSGEAIPKDDTKQSSEKSSLETAT